MKIAIVGATGLVGQEILEVIRARNVAFDKLLLVASPKSMGKVVKFMSKNYSVIGMDDAISEEPDIAIFSAGRTTSLEWAPQFEEAGAVVIDNSSAWRMSPRHKLIVPEINAGILRIDDRIIANPNCSTIQMVLVLAPLHRRFGIKRIVVSTYQSVSGTGKEAVEQMMDERAGRTGKKVYPHQIDMNALPHIDVFQEDGYTKEEIKMVNETKKILDDNDVQVTATCVRIPTVGGHSEAVNVEFKEDYTLDEIREILNGTEGVIIQDDPQNNVYPMPITSHKKDDVFVGRIRRDETQPGTVNMWIVADNLRKGAAANAVQIAEYLMEHHLAHSVR